jgi:hypothetical protein
MTQKLPVTPLHPYFYTIGLEDIRVHSKKTRFSTKPFKKVPEIWKSFPKISNAQKTIFHFYETFF